MKQADRDQTVFLNMEQPRPDPGLPSSFRPVATSDANRARSSIPYVAQQTSVSNYSSGLNPLVNAASDLLLSIVRIRATHKEQPFRHQENANPPARNENIEHLRARLEAEIRAFESRALASSDIELPVMYYVPLWMKQSRSLCTVKMGNGENTGCFPPFTMKHGAGKNFSKFLIAACNSRHAICIFWNSSTFS